MGAQNLKNSDEFLTNKAVPEMLLVIGNGFDLSCNVPSNYISFLKKILEKKLHYSPEELKRDGYDDIFDYVSLEIERYLEEDGFLNQTPMRQGNIVPELNSWYIMFIIKKMTYDTDWYQVEDQIASQLFVSDNKMNIIESISDVLLSIYQRDRPGIRIPRNSYIKGHEIDKIYKLLAFNLLYKKLHSFKLESTKDIFNEFRNKEYELWEDYITKCNTGNKEYDMAFEKRLVKELFPLVAQVLLAELRELEKDFNDYLIKELDHLDLSYQRNAIDLIYKIFSRLYSCPNNKVTIPYNIISFNYTTPWDRGDNVANLDPVFYTYLCDVKNLHGALSRDTSEIIFGIDDEFISPLSNEYIFTKPSRTLDLYSQEKNENFQEYSDIKSLMPNTIKDIVFYGHSLSQADYSYFKIILDTFIPREDVVFTFVYNVHKATTDLKSRRDIIERVSSLFGEYSKLKQSNTNIFVNLIQNNRIRIVKL